MLEWLSKDTEIDIFLVGGGSSGGTDTGTYALCGGGGGYTKTVKKIKVTKGQRINIIIGSGGALKGMGSTGYNNGGDTSWDSITVKGGNGKNGGSGGGAGAGEINSVGGNGANGGEDGSDGGNSSYGSNSTQVTGGKGQGESTREFGEPGAELYSSAGGGAAIKGTAGRGGKGTPQLSGNGKSSLSGGAASTGGGGYGGGGGSGNAEKGAGAQGIVVIRDTREVA